MTYPDLTIRAGDVIVDQVRIIGTRCVVWKAWKRCDTRSAKWPYSYGFYTITHFDGVPYGRMGTEFFDGYRGPDTQRNWDELIGHKVRCASAAHLAIVAAYPLAVEGTFDDNGTIEMEV
jgi:hypothetical protein